MEVALDAAIVHEEVAAGSGLLLCLFGIEVGKFFVFEFRDRFGEDLLIGLVAKVGDESALLGP